MRLLQYMSGVRLLSEIWFMWGHKPVVMNIPLLPILKGQFNFLPRVRRTPNHSTRISSYVPLSTFSLKSLGFFPSIVMPNATQVPATSFAAFFTS